MAIVSLVFGSLAGMSLMYFLDPATGRRRRALLRDQLVKLRHTTSDQVEGLAGNTANKVRGAVAEAVQQFSTDDVSDEVLVAQIRSEMGRYVSHPSAVVVTTDAGVVTLTGKILTQEVQPFVDKVTSMPGVRRVENRMQAYEEASHTSDL